MTAPPEPFLRWVGGKRALAPRLLELAPGPTARWSRYVEPFLGGGAMFWALSSAGRLRGRAVLLADASERLVRTYRAVAGAPGAVVEAFRRRAPADRVVTEGEYLAAREEPVDDFEADVEVAAWMLFVNRASFNALYRVNRKGKFNVPFGEKARPLDPGEANLYACSAALGAAKAELVAAPFDDVVGGSEARRPRIYPVGEGDFVYADPPYDSEGGKGFTQYTAEGFGDADQARLARLLAEAAEDGARVLASNALTDKVLGRYARPTFRVAPLSAPRAVAADASSRGAVVEAVITAGYRPRAQRPRAPEATQHGLGF